MVQLSRVEASPIIVIFVFLHLSTLLGHTSSNEHYHQIELTKWCLKVEESRQLANRTVSTLCFYSISGPDFLGGVLGPKLGKLEIWDFGGLDPRFGDLDPRFGTRPLAAKSVKNPLLFAQGLQKLWCAQQFCMHVTLLK